MSAKMSREVDTRDMPAQTESHTSNRVDRGGPAARRHRKTARHRRPEGTTIAVNFAPMIDVTFLLLIFFLVTTTFERAEGILASKMAKDSGVAQVALPLTPIVVRLTQTGEGHDDVAIQLERFPQEQPRTFSELTEAIRRIHELPGFDRDTPLVIAAGSDVRWDHVVGCWNAAVRAGCSAIAFGEQ